MLIHDPRELHNHVSKLRSEGKRIALVPTMGALHAGHLSLVEAAINKSDTVVVSIFVNPAQFGPNEDYAKYPRSLETDIELLKKLNSKVPIIVFAPNTETMYPEGVNTSVGPGPIANLFEGAVRPGHFSGVLTVVLKLILISGADTAFFGRKDYQQLLLVREMVRDLNVPIEVIDCPIFREPDGLAMSSRNRYLSQSERKQATVLFKSLQKAEELIDSGESDPMLITAAMTEIVRTAENAEIDYIAIVDPLNLEPHGVIFPDTPIAILIALRIGSTRLIDNHIIRPVLLV